MRRLLDLALTFGWLIWSQALFFVISITGFAILARLIGSGPYAQFAVAIFVFTMVALLTDLSAQNLLLIRGATTTTIAVAQRLAAASALTGVLLLLITGAVATFFGVDLMGTSGGWLLIAAALVAQAAMQVPRGIVIASGSYRSIFIADVTGGLGGVLLASVLAFHGVGLNALLAQLAATAGLRTTVLAASASGIRRNEEEGTPMTFREGLKYGTALIPLNLSAYLSRSIDSGILPFLVPAAAAAGYARSYQVVIAPISQIQIALGPVILRRLALDRANHGIKGHAAPRLWGVLFVSSLGTGLAIVMGAPLIETVLFGPEWPGVHMTIAAMGTTLPALALSAFCLWSIQVDGAAKSVWSHVIAGLVAPSAVLVTASFLTFGAALTGLVVVGGLVYPLILLSVHARRFPIPRRALLAQLVGAWAVLALLFTLLSRSATPALLM